MDKLGRRWMNVELEPEFANDFRRFLRENGIKYEASEAWNLIHFECLVDEVDRDFVDWWLDAKKETERLESDSIIRDFIEYLDGQGLLEVLDEQ